MKNNTHEVIKEDVLKVCIDFYNHANRDSLCYISINASPINDNTLSCEKQITPFKMRDMGLLYEVENFNDVKNRNKLNSISFRANTIFQPTLLHVRFNQQEILRYLSLNGPISIKNHIKRVGKHEIWKNSFRFHRHKLHLPPFLTLAFSTRDAMNSREKLIELVVSAKKEGRTYSVLINKLSEQGGHPLSEKTLSAMIATLNKERFSKAKGAEIKLVTFTKEDDKKYVRMQVIPST